MDCSKGEHMTTVTPDGSPTGKVEILEEAVIRFAGDSGDGMQLTGNQFSDSAALFGNDLATFPDFPAEIRAPIGTLAGVSAFQVRISSNDIHTPGHLLDVLVAMNPAALKVHLPDLKHGGILLVNTGNFGKRDWEKAGYTSNPLEDETIVEPYHLVQVDLNHLTKETLKDTNLDNKAIMRCKNFAALGILLWMFNRDLEPTIRAIKERFGKKAPEIADANVAVLVAGRNYAETVELLDHTFQVDQAELEPGIYRNIMGNQATGLGLLAASKLTGVQLFLGSYPITPASDILHQLSSYKQDGVITFQAEDEIAAICSTVGAAYAGMLAVTTTSGPGVALKTEALGLGVMAELPFVVVNVQRGGPSTGLPTKTEQADLYQAIWGRNGECPLPVLAAASPVDCFYMAIEAFRIATKYMTPVLLLTDGYLANGSEPWKLPKIEDLPKFEVHFETNPEGFQPYKRDPETLARPWVRPGTKGMQHRIGGLEKEDGSGNVSYDSENHFHMVKTRQAKVMGIAKDIPAPELHGDSEGDLLVLGWGSTYGSIYGAVDKARKEGFKVSQLHLRHVFPLPEGVDKILAGFKRILVPEMNMGQLTNYMKTQISADYISYPKVTGKPFYNDEVLRKIREVLA